MFRKSILALASLGLLWAQTSGTTPPKAEALLDAYVEATGGKAAYQALRSQRIMANVEFVGQGIQGKSVTITGASGDSLTTLEIPGAGKILSGTKGGVSWESSAMQGPRLRAGEEKIQNARMTDLGGPSKWREHVEFAEVAGEESVEGVACWKIRTRTKGVAGDDFTWVDRATGLVKKAQMKTKSQMGEIPVETFIREYRKEGGILIPVRTEQKVGPMTIRTSVESVETNIDLPANAFDYPAEISALVAKTK
jgi:hypothetical protein